MAYKYEFDGFDYLLIDDNGDTIDRMDEVSVCFDKTDSVLLKHGDPKKVYKYYEETRRKIALLNDFDGGMLFDICFIQGRFPVEEVNKCLDICDYVGIFYKKMIGVKNES